MKKTFFKIDDTSDLTKIKTERDSKTFNKNRKDEIKDSKIKPLKEYKNSFYVLATTSNKVINNRTYNDESLRQMVLNNSWTSPYNRPVLKHHKQYSGEPLGRIILSYYIEHETSKIITNSEEKLPKKVIDFFSEKNAFSVGTGSIILKCFCDDEEFKRIQDGLDLTISQGVYAEKITCNVCGCSYFDCDHFSGESYKMDDKDIVCIPEAGGEFEAIEISIVNVPANDTSLIYILEEENNGNTNDNKDVEKKSLQIDNKIIVCQDGKQDDISVDNSEKNNLNEIKDKTTEENKNNVKGEEMYKNLLKNTISDNLKKAFNNKEEIINAFSELFDCIEAEDGIEKLKKLIDAFETTINEEKLKAVVSENQVKDTEEEKKVEGEAKDKKEEPEETKVKDEKNNNENVDKQIQDTKKILENEIKDLQNSEDKKEDKKEDNIFSRFLINNL